jgi:hypothetical protein
MFCVLGFHMHSEETFLHTHTRARGLCVSELSQVHSRASSSEIMVDEVALKQVFLKVFRFSVLIILIPEDGYLLIFVSCCLVVEVTRRFTGAYCFHNQGDE